MFVLDTNVLKAITRSRPPQNARNVVKWFNDVDETDIYLSVTAVMEQRKGIERKRADDPDTAAELERRFTELLTTFADRILPIDLDAAQEWGRMVAQREKHVLDLSIAATAKTKQFTVVTRDTDFQGRGVRLLDPYRDPPVITAAN